MNRSWTVLGPDGRPYESAVPGTLGGHRRTRVYGRLDCPGALRWIARGHYVRHRVFFADEATARAAEYRPCAVCLPDAYRSWRAWQAASVTQEHEHQHTGAPAPGDHAAWDERYGAAEQVWSGEPNGALVAEVASLAPGTALDVGCGEGADAVWLARRGWRVTALDVSRVALDRAERHARDSGVDVTWVRSGLVEADLATFDLVSALYPALRSTPEHEAERALLRAVAPGGLLLVVHHADVEAGGGHGFDPRDYVLPADVAALLRAEDGWVVEVDERRPRFVRSGAGAGHTHDLVLRARRSPAG